ncbi:endothelin-converting enzyme 1 [Trichonephila inaurata madagascariensis]|uniref:Endothelin-converting enzyme 1 n=1 Tax=Trichonephila inaurata madagascariensis TaxID=2747483 RepID=A0A8X6YEG1_9ARAC|nr:endothelin-converting enzyme 1 [Trichonephila inaurata madagascariensis]
MSPRDFPVFGPLKKHLKGKRFNSGDIPRTREGLGLASHRNSGNKESCGLFISGIMTDYQRVDLNEASGSKNMAIEDSPSTLNSTNGFSKADENQERNSPAAGVIFGRGDRRWRNTFWRFLIVLLLLVLILFIVSVIRVHNTDEKYCTTPACVKAAATILNSLDQTVDPCENFYQYACGGWLKSNPLPEDKTTFSRFLKLSDDNNRILKYVLEDERFELKGEAEKQARIMYRSCMNKTRIEELGAQPLLELLKKRRKAHYIRFLFFITFHILCHHPKAPKIMDIAHEEYDSGNLKN